LAHGASSGVPCSPVGRALNSSIDANYDRWNDTMTRYREHFASVVYTKTMPTK
jgi:hypothetical protein